MKIASYIHDGQASYGIVEGPTLNDIGFVLRSSYPDLKSLLRAGVDTARAAASDAPRLALADVKLLPTIPNPDKIFGVGYNYLSHIEETGKPVPEHPFIFARFADSQVGSGQAMVRPRVSAKFDYQGALAVVIGAPGRHIRLEDALAHVAGYACYNDGSVRDWQKHTTQFIAGKNFPLSGGFGPWLVTSDELPDPASLEVVTRHNGTEVQRESVSHMIFNVPALIAYCSTFTNLNPGDVIITGTPGGVGALHTPPLWLHAGVEVEVEISGIGVLRNPVVDEALS